jgi:1,4-dihydroxy-2-naphthoyl-CoA synthase
MNLCLQFPIPPKQPSRNRPAMSLDIPKTNLVLVSREGGVAVVELNRPKKRNALSQELIDELTGVLRQLDKDTEVRVVVLTSSGDSPFCGMLG